MNRKLLLFAALLLAVPVHGEDEEEGSGEAAEAAPAAAEAEEHSPAPRPVRRALRSPAKKTPPAPAPADGSPALGSEAVSQGGAGIGSAPASEVSGSGGFQRLGSGGGSAGEPAAQGGKIKCAVFNSLEEMPHPGGQPKGHGILAFSGPNQCVSVGVLITRKESHGICHISESPASPSDDACSFTFWISKAPGGPPVSARCKVGPVSSRGGHLDFSGGADVAGCKLPAGTHYCNVISEGWNHPEQPPRRCGAIVGSPMMQRL